MSSYIYLREMNPTERGDADVIVKQSISSLPYTLAMPIKQLFAHVAAGSYGMAMNYALDFVEMSTQYISMLLLVRLIDLERTLPVEQRGVNRVIHRIDNKRPLSLGDWINDILTPLLLIAKDRIADDTLVASLTTHLLRKHSCVLLGDKREPSVVKIRNEYRGHGTTLSENIYRGVIYTLEPQIMTLLLAMRPLWGYNFYSVPGEGVRLSHKGADASVDIATAEGDLLGHYYVESADHKIDLYPLVMVNEQRYVYVFQTLKDESARYISTNENAVTLNDDSYNYAIDALFRQVSPQFDVAKELNWDQITTMAQGESKRFMSRIYREKKYNRELFVDRKHISQGLAKFYKSDATLYPILGEAGQGKTNQLCFWTERLIEEGKCVIIFSSADFATTTLDDSIRNIFALSPRKDISQFLESLQQKAEQNEDTH